ncbi:MAG: M48 family metalloprotease [Thermoanaerobaculia bacterium]
MFPVLRSRAVVFSTLAVFALSCASTHLPPISSAGSQFEPFKDEVRLWDEARAEEQKLLAETPLYEDPLLEDYLQGVVDGLTPPGMAANRQLRYRVRVVEDPSLNAFAYPHGSMYVHTGLLARMENEDQLATVLGHEMTHVENRHSLRYRRSARNKQIGFSIAALAAAVVLAGEEGDAWGEGEWARAARVGVLGDILLTLGLQLAFLASVNGYGRGLEEEADVGGFNKMLAAGYDLRESPKVYQALLEDHGDPGKVEAFFFGSHPKLANRITNAEERVAALPAASLSAPPTAPAAPSDEFSRRIRSVVRDDARLNIEAGRLKLAADELARAKAALPEDPEVHFLIARLKLAQADASSDAAKRTRLLEGARAALEKSRRLGLDRPELDRELGLMAYRAEDWAAACEHFARYVDKAGGAPDVSTIRGYLLELQRDGHCRG